MILSIRQFARNNSIDIMQQVEHKNLHCQFCLRVLEMLVSIFTNRWKVRNSAGGALETLVSGFIHQVEH